MRNIDIRNVSLVTIYYGFLKMSLYGIYTYFTLFLFYIGYQYSEIGLVFAIGAIGMLFGNYLGGFLADKLGRKFPLFLSSLVISLALYLFSVFTTFLYVVISYFLFDIGQTLCISSLNAILGESVDKEFHQKISAISYGVSTVSGVISIGLLIMALYKNPLQKVMNEFFTLTSILTLILILITALIKETYRGEQERNVSSEKVSIFSILTGLRLKFLLLMSLIFFSFPTFWVLLSVYANIEVGVSLIEWGIIAAIWFIVYSPIQTIMSKFTEKINPSIGFLASGILFSLSAILISLKLGFFLFVIAIILEVICESILWPIVFKVEMMLTREEFRGRYIGLVNSMGSAMMSLGNFAGSNLYYIKPELPILSAMIIFLTTSITLSKQFK